MCISKLYNSSIEFDPRDDIFKVPTHSPVTSIFSYRSRRLFVRLSRQHSTCIVFWTFSSRVCVHRSVTISQQQFLSGLSATFATFNVIVFGRFRVHTCPVLPHRDALSRSIASIGKKIMLFGDTLSNIWSLCGVLSQSLRDQASLRGGLGPVLYARRL